MPVGAVTEVEGHEELEKPGFVVCPLESDFSFLEGTLETCDCPVGSGSLMERNWI